MLAIEIFRLGRGRRLRFHSTAESGRHDIQHHFWFARFINDRGNPTLERQGLGFATQVMSSAEDDGSSSDPRIFPQLAHELVTIHRRHQHVADDQIGMMFARNAQTLGAVRRFTQIMMLVTEQRRQKLPVHGTVIDNENLCHYYFNSFVPLPPGRGQGRVRSLTPTGPHPNPQGSCHRGLCR